MSQHYNPQSYGHRTMLANVTNEAHNRSNRQSPHQTASCDPSSISPLGIHVPDPAFAAAHPSMLMPNYLQQAQQQYATAAHVTDPAMLMLGGSPLSSAGGNSPMQHYSNPYATASAAHGLSSMMSSPQQAHALATAAAAAAGVPVPSQLSLADLDLFTRMTTQIFQTMMSAQQQQQQQQQFNGGHSPLGTYPSFGHDFETAQTSPMMQHLGGPGFASSLNSGAMPFHSAAGGSYPDAFQTMISSMMQQQHQSSAEAPVVASEQELKDLTDREASITGAHHDDAHTTPAKPSKPSTAGGFFDSAIIAAHLSPMRPKAAAADSKSYADALTPVARRTAPQPRSVNAAAQKPSPQARSAPTAAQGENRTPVAAGKPAKQPATSSQPRSAPRSAVKTAVPSVAPTKAENDADDSVTPARTTLYAVFQLSRGQVMHGVSPIRISVNDYVLLEGDRGVDLGRVMSVSNEAPAPVADSPNVPRFRRNPPRVHRLATPSEVTQLTQLSEDAAKSVPVCQEAVDRLRLPLRVVDAQFQFDRKKLTFFYDSDERVDFRDLLHEMYSVYKCRIWMARSDEQISA